MRRLNLKQNALLRQITHLNVKKGIHKEKHDFIREAKQITQNYIKYKNNPNFKYFLKYLIENLAIESDASTVNEIANELKRIFSRKINEELNEIK